MDKFDQEFVSKAKEIIIYRLSKSSALGESERARECCFKIAPQDAIAVWEKSWQPICANNGKFGFPIRIQY